MDILDNAALKLVEFLLPASKPNISFFPDFTLTMLL
jgi:hypothetical protein